MLEKLRAFIVIAYYVLRSEAAHWYEYVEGVAAALVVLGLFYVALFYWS